MSLQSSSSTSATAQGALSFVGWTSPTVFETVTRWAVPTLRDCVKGKPFTPLHPWLHSGAPPERKKYETALVRHPCRRLNFLGKGSVIRRKARVTRWAFL